VFDAHGNERIDQWRQLRNNLETDQEPFSTALNVWCRAPLVNSYLDPSRPRSWPDPWHLILDNRYDDLALTLGIMYTLKLTQRFMAVEFEIHMSMLEKESFYLLAADHVCFDISRRQIIAKSDIPENSTTLIYHSDQEK
jgi:hypothetical protein